MRRHFAAGISAPLLFAGLASILSGCPTGIVGTNEADPNPPTVTAVYAQDRQGTALAGAPLPDVALYLSADPGSTSGGPRISAAAPSSYGAIRIELNTTLDPATAPATETLNGATNCVQAASVHFLDVTGSATVAPNTEIPSSVCYDPTTAIGGNPAIVVIPGNIAAPAVFTCQTFTQVGKLLPSHTYAIKLDAANLKGANGKALVAPTGGGWSSGVFTFTTTAFEILETAYQDPSTGYFHVLDKASRGFLKDLNPEDAATFRETTGQDPFYIFLSDVPKTASDGTPLTSDVTPTPAVTVQRAKDGSDFPAFIDNATYTVNGISADPRVIAVTPVETWEPGVQYKVTVKSTLAASAARGGAALGGSDRVYTFTAATGSTKAISSNILANATAVTLGSVIDVEFQSPIDPASVTAANVQLLQGTTPVPADVALVTDANNQTVEITPQAPLTPSTEYTVKINNLKTAAVPSELAGKTFDAYTNTFRTITFGIQRIANGTTSTTSIDRSTAQSALLPATGNLTVTFNSTPTGVDSTSLKLLELAPDGVTTTDTGATVTPVAGSTTKFTLKVPATYAVKFNQRYQVRASTSITGAGTNVKSEGCTGTGDACAEIRTFQTTPFVATIPAANVSTTTGKFRVTFSYGADSTTIDPQLPLTAASDKAVKLFKQAADGSLTAVAITCTPLQATSATARKTFTDCQPAANLDANSPYVINVVFTSANPAKVAPTLVVVAATATAPEISQPADQTTGSFAGNRSLNVRSACAP